MDWAKVCACGREKEWESITEWEIFRRELPNSQRRRKECGELIVHSSWGTPTHPAILVLLWVNLDVWSQYWVLFDHLQNEAQNTYCLEGNWDHEIMICTWDHVCLESWWVVYVKFGFMRSRTWIWDHGISRDRCFQVDACFTTYYIIWHWCMYSTNM